MEAKARTRRRDPEKETFWRELMAQRRQNSGQSVRVFCKEAGVTESQYYHWQHTLRVRETEDASLAGFTEVVRRVPRATSTGSGVSLELTGGHKIQLAHDFDVTVLRRAVAALEEGVRT